MDEGENRQTNKRVAVVVMKKLEINTLSFVLLCISTLIPLGNPSSLAELEKTAPGFV